MTADRDVSTIEAPPGNCNCRNKHLRGRVWRGGPGSTQALAYRLGDGGEPFLARPVRRFVGSLGTGELAWFVGTEADALARRGMLVIEP